MARQRNTVNPIDVVEAAYDLDGDDRVWLEKLARTIQPLLDGGAGMLTYQFDVRTPMTEWHANGIMFDMDPGHIQLIRDVGVEHAEHATNVHTNFEGLLAMSKVIRDAGLGDTIAEAMPRLAHYYNAVGIVDYVALQTVEPGGKGIVFSAGQKQMRTWDAKTRRLWARVNAHIAAGRRLREAIASSVRDQGTEEAVLTPSGKLEHAEGETKERSAREALRAAVASSESARGRAQREHPEAAVEAWTALVSGRWSLVDRFEKNGRRYIVARRNEHMLPDPRALSSRERAIAHLAALGKPNKLIAYELGLAESTVGSHLSTVMRKLGVSSRVELIRMVAQLAMPKPDS